MTHMVFREPNYDQVYAIVARLRPGQRATIMGLDGGPSVLGCSEDTARRMTKPAASRPPLVSHHAADDDNPFPRFALTDWGQAVKAALGLAG
jgi:hypothetical protein